MSRFRGISDAWVNYWLRDAFWGGIDYLTHYGLRCLPPVIVSKLGEQLGLLAGSYRFAGLNARVDKNLEELFPGIAEEKKRRLSRNMWGNIGRTLAELSVNDRIPSANIEITGEQYITRKLGPDIPVLFLFVHLGNWELLLPNLLRYVPSLHVIYERLPNRFQRQISCNARRRVGVKLLSPDYSGTHAIYSVLGGKGALLMAMDEFKHDIVYAPLFGRTPQKNNNIDYALRLAKKFGAVIAPVCCVRKTGIRFSIHWRPVITPDRLDNDEKAVRAELHNQLEVWVREHIDQWYMLHRLCL